MARIHWNFVSRRWWARPSGLVCIAALAGCMHAFWWRETLLQRRTELMEQTLEAEEAKGPGNRRIPAPTPPVLGHIFEEMRHPWNDVLESLQRATRPGVEILELEPDADNVRRVHIQGVADGVQNVFGLLAALQNDPLWSNVQLVSQTKADEAATQQGNAQASSSYPPLPTVSSRRYTFTLVAQWKHA
jgi:hypothetical protein